MIVKELLKDHTRFDRRSLLEQRTYNIEKLENFYLYTGDNTQIIAMYYISQSKPYKDKPNEGIVTFNCISTFRRTDRLNSFLKKIYINSKCIDLEALCIKYGVEVKNIVIELRILTNDSECYESSVNIVNYLLKDLDISVNFVPSCFYFVAIDNLILRDPIDIEDNDKDWYYLIVKKSRNEYLFIEKAGKENTLDDIYQILEISSDTKE